MGGLMKLCLYRVVSGGSGLALALMLAACGTKIGIETLSHPVERVEGLLVDLDGRGYSPGTREMLQREGLSRQARKDPLAVIRLLQGQLGEGARPDIRLGAAELAMRQARKLDDSDLASQLGYLLTAIELSEPGLSMSEVPQYPALKVIYNEANAELASRLHQQSHDLSKRVALATPLGRRELGWATGAQGTRNPRFYDTLTPRSWLKVKGFEEINQRPGVGGSMVGYRATTEERKADDPFIPLTGYAIPVTAVARRGSGARVDLTLYDGLVEDRVRVGGKSFALASDFTAAVATAVNAAPGSKVGFLGMIHPQSDQKLEGLYQLEPYRSDRIPLVLVHGLMSTPDTWRVVVNACYADPVIRKNYQLLVFFYPTGYAIAQNAATLRERLKAYHQRYDPNRSNPKMRQMVMVGHSMGCNLTNFQIRDGGDPLWDTFFTESIDETLASPELKARAKRGSYFKANPDIARVVFICGPHRGSPLSDSWLGRFGARLIRLPYNSANALSGNALGATTDVGRTVFSEPSSSINNLEIGSPILEEVLRLPMPYHPPIHTIVGDRGKGGGVNSSDGVVPYWSAHLDYAKSEKFIPASHVQATKNPENALELRRILHLHVGSKVPVSAASN
jgi:pimeloyl-ACP methyl ester carboxylesterase